MHLGTLAIAQARSQGGEGRRTQELQRDRSRLHLGSYLLYEFAGNAARVNKARVIWTRGDQQDAQRRRKRGRKCWEFLEKEATYNGDRVLRAQGEEALL